MSCLAKARAAWGAPPPWIVALAAAADAASQRRVAKHVGLTNCAVSQAIANKYPGDMKAMKAKVEKVLAAEMRQAEAGGWGVEPPDWIAALAEACRREPQTAVARRLEYSASVVSQVLANTYKGDIRRIEAIVRGALMGETVACAVLGPDLARHACVSASEREMGGKHTATALTRAYRAECPRCPHFIGRRRDAG